MKYQSDLRRNTSIYPSPWFAARQPGLIHRVKMDEPRLIECIKLARGTACLFCCGRRLDQGFINHFWLDTCPRLVVFFHHAEDASSQ